MLRDDDLLAPRRAVAEFGEVRLRLVEADGRGLGHPQGYADGPTDQQPCAGLEVAVGAAPPPKRERARPERSADGARSLSAERLQRREVVEQGVAGGDGVIDASISARPSSSRSLPTAVRVDERDDGALLAGAAGAAGAVQVGLVLVRGVGLDRRASMSSTWMPRAATSVATSTFTRPLVSCCEVARAARLVEVAVQARRPGCRRPRAGRRAARRRRGCGRRPASCRRRPASCSMIAPLSRCSMSEHAVVDRGGGLVLTGDLVHGRVRRGTPRRASPRPCRGWRRRAASGRRPWSWRRMRCTGSRKPRSHMWSASSSTVMATSLRSSRPCSMRSSMRPGVPMMMSTPRCSAPTWRCLRHAAVDLRGEEADAAGDRLHGAVDLQGQLARRGEDERARACGRSAVLRRRRSPSAARRAGRRRRWSCRSRCGRGRARRGPRAPPGWSPPGSGTGSSRRARRARGRCCRRGRGRRSVTPSTSSASTACGLEALEHDVVLGEVPASRRVLG